MATLQELEAQYEAIQEQIRLLHKDAHAILGEIASLKVEAWVSAQGLPLLTPGAVVSSDVIRQYLISLNGMYQWDQPAIEGFCSPPLTILGFSMHESGKVPPLATISGDGGGASFPYQVAVEAWEKAQG